jgi:hypothetical protein
LPGTAPLHADVAVELGRLLSTRRERELNRSGRRIVQGDGERGALETDGLRIEGGLVGVSEIEVDGAPMSSVASEQIASATSQSRIRLAMVGRAPGGERGP